MFSPHHIFYFAELKWWQEKKNPINKIDFCKAKIQKVKVVHWVRSTKMQISQSNRKIPLLVKTFFSRSAVERRLCKWVFLFSIITAQMQSCLFSLKTKNINGETMKCKEKQMVLQRFGWDASGIAVALTHTYLPVVLWEALQPILTRHPANSWWTPIWILYFCL